jgi:ribonuclease R
MLTGRSLGWVFRLGDRVEVRVREVEVASGAIALELVSGGQEGKAPSGVRTGPAEKRGRAGGPGKGGPPKFKPSRKKKPGTSKPRKKGKNR